MSKVHSIEKTDKHFGNKELLYAVGVTAICFAATKAQLLGFPSPFNVAVLAACNAGVIPAFLACIAGYLLFGGLEIGMVQICAMLVIVALKLLILPREKRQSPAVMAVSSTAAMAGFGFIVSVLLPADLYTTCYRLMSAVLCGCVTYFLMAVAQRTSTDGLLDINGLRGASLGILFVVAACTLASVQIGSVNLGRTAGMFVMLAAMTRYGHIGGAVCGALTTCGVILCAPQLADNTLLLASAGLIVGAFAALGAFATVAAFLLILIISLSVVGMNADTFPMIADGIAASAIYAAVPRSAVRAMLRHVGGTKNAVEIVGQTASARLSFASKTLRGIRGQIDTVTKSMDKKSAAVTLESLAPDLLCRDCAGCTECWNNHTDETAAALRALEALVLKNGLCTDTDVRFSHPRCVQPKALAEVFTTLYAGHLYEQSNRLRARELREILTEQLGAMEDVLNDLSHRVSQISYVDASLSEQASRLAVRRGCTNARACVYRDESQTMRAELFTPADFNPDPVKLTADLSDIIGCDMDLPVVTVTDKIAKFTFTELPVFSVSSDQFQIAGSAGEYSGDWVETLSVSATEEYFILSDGMGTGRRAKLDSMFATSLVTRLLTAGVSPETAVRMINLILRVKGWDESFATLDVARIDLCRGTLDLLKAGAAASYILRDEVLIKAEAQSFPLGILGDVPAVSLHYKLFPGDRILLVSDGVDELTVKKYAAQCFCAPQSELKNAVIRFGETALEHQKQGKQDDITILAIQIASAY
ncbi:MAG: PP2C family protein-serine/threonine phosphatase [Oscillospiraceae bacterium]